LLLLFLPPFTSVSATIDVEHYAAVSITEVDVFPVHALPAQPTIQPLNSSTPTQGIREAFVPHVTLQQDVFRRMAPPGRVNSPSDTSFIRARIARMLNVPGLSPLEASMLRDYELYGTYYDPPNIDMDEFQLPLSDVTTALSKIF